MSPVRASSPAIPAVLLLAGCATTPEAPEISRYTIEQFLDTESVSGGSFSADEGRILYSSDKSGVFNAYSVPAAGGTPTQLTDSSDTTYAISYFPEDDRVLLMRDNGGDEIYHIFLRNEDGSVEDLTPDDERRALFYGWAHDLKAFFYLSNRRDPNFMDLYEMDIDTFESSMLYENTEGLDVTAISRDKRYLTLDKPITTNDNEMYLFDRQSKQRKHLSPHTGDAQFSAADFTADGKALYYRTNVDGEFMYLAKMDLSSLASETIASPDWDVMYANLSWDGKYLIMGVNADARTEITVTEVATGSKVDLPEMPSGDITGVGFSRSERKMLFYHSGPRSPRNLYVQEIGQAQPARLTDTMNPEINPDHLVDIEVVRYKSFDGLEIPALLMKPHMANGEKVPALVQVHGGPGGQTRVGYNALYQYLVNHGYAMLMVNNRGSSGYGKTFYKLDDHKHGQDDLMDCVKGKEYLISTGFVDPERIGILGGSYGGYMVLAALAFQPEAFDVGVDIFGVANWVRTLKSIPPWWTAYRDALYAELGNPETEEEYLHKISPLFHASNIVKPLIVLQGANDPRVLKVESDEMVEAVRANGVPVEYVIFDDEGHGFTKKENRIQGYKAILDFLETHLRGAAAAETS